VTAGETPGMARLRADQFCLYTHRAPEFQG
jgi:hypothetical protein